MIDCIAENIHAVIHPKYDWKDNAEHIMRHLKIKEGISGTSLAIGKVKTMKCIPKLSSCGYRTAPNVICEGVYD